LLFAKKSNVTTFSAAAAPVAKSSNFVIAVSLPLVVIISKIF